MAKITVSRRGDIVLPASVCRSLGLKPGSQWQVELTDDGIAIRPVSRKRQAMTTSREFFPATQEELLAAASDAALLNQAAVQLIVEPPPPAIEQPVAVPRPQRSYPTPIDQAPKFEALPTVMVVDDSFTVRKVAQRLLEREGFQVVLASDGVDALAQLQSITPHVMLVDIEMPRMDGFELARAVQAHQYWREVPIIIISSFDDAHYRQAAQSIGVRVFLDKPYDAAELLGHVRRFVNEVMERFPSAYSHTLI